MPLARPSLLRVVIAISVAVVFTSCGSKKYNNDPLGIGLSPEFPDKRQALAGTAGEFPPPVQASNDNPDPFDIRARFSERPAGKRFTPVRLTSAWGLSVQTTIWALATGNWLWGYSPAFSSSFGEAPNWFVAEQPNGNVTFVNALSNGGGRIPTCMEPYNTGVIHQPCGIGNPKPQQQFKLLPTINGGMLIVSAATKQCLTTAKFSNRFSWALTMESCSTAPGTEVDRTQVWTLTPWPIAAEALVFATTP